MPPPSKLVPVRLEEAQIAEGNLLEYPVFKLSNKEARPTRENGLIAREDYTTEHVLERPGPEGSTLVRRVVVQADVHSGYPTMFAFRVLVAIITKCGELGFVSARVPITRGEICRRLGLTTYGGTEFRLVDQACAALRHLSIAYHDSWYDAHTRCIHPGIRHAALISNYSFAPEARGRSSQMSLPYDQWAEIGEALFESLRAGFRIGVDLNYLNRLPTDTSRRLYDYLTKKDGNSAREYTESLRSLAAKMPLAPSQSRYVSTIKRILEPALKLLVTPLAPDGKQFLSGYRFEGAGADTRLVVFFRAGMSFVDQVKQAALAAYGQKTPPPARKRG